MSIINRIIKTNVDNVEEFVLVLDKIFVDQNRPVTAYLCLRESGQTVITLPEEIVFIAPAELEKGWLQHAKKNADK